MLQYRMATIRREWKSTQYIYTLHLQYSSTFQKLRSILLKRTLKISVSKRNTVGTFRLKEIM